MFDQTIAAAELHISTTELKVGLKLGLARRLLHLPNLKSSGWLK